MAAVLRLALVAAAVADAVEEVYQAAADRCVQGID